MKMMGTSHNGVGENLRRQRITRIKKITASVISKILLSTRKKSWKKVLCPKRAKSRKKKNYLTLRQIGAGVKLNIKKKKSKIILKMSWADSEHSMIIMLPQTLI